MSTYQIKSATCWIDLLATVEALMRETARPQDEVARLVKLRSQLIIQEKQKNAKRSTA